MRKLVILLMTLWAVACSPALAQNTRVYTACGGAAWSNNDLGRPLQLAPDGTLCIQGSISASLAGFTPNGNFGSLTATAASSASTALPAGAVVVLQNTSQTIDVSCVLHATSAVATTDKIIVHRDSSVGVTVGSNTQVACINQTGASSIVVALMGGTGLWTNFGAGGGGGGGAITIADGADVALGAKADAAAGTDTATATLIALIKRLNQNLTTINGNVVAPIPAQATNAVNIGAVMNAGSQWETVAASQTAQVLGTTGAAGNYLSHCMVYPTTTTPGVVTVFDDTSSAANNVIAFPGGASSVSNLVPFALPVGAISVTGAWKVTTGANLVVTCYGKFT